MYQTRNFQYNHKENKSRQHNLYSILIFNYIRYHIYHNQRKEQNNYRKDDGWNYSNFTTIVYKMKNFLSIMEL